MRNFRGSDSRRQHVIREYGCELIFVLRLDQDIDQPFRQLGECSVRGSEYRKWSCSLQRVREARGFKSGGQGLECAGGHGGFQNIELSGRDGLRCHLLVSSFVVENIWIGNIAR